MEKLERCFLFNVARGNNGTGGQCPRKSESSVIEVKKHEPGTEWR